MVVLIVVRDLVSMAMAGFGRLRINSNNIERNPLGASSKYSRIN